MKHSIVLVLAAVGIVAHADSKIPLRISNNSPEKVTIVQLTDPQDKEQSNKRAVVLEPGKQVDMATTWKSKKAVLPGIKMVTPTKTYFVMFDNNTRLGISDTPHQLTILQAGVRDVRDVGGLITAIPLLGVEVRKNDGKKPVFVKGVLTEKDNVILLV